MGEPSHVTGLPSDWRPKVMVTWSRLGPMGVIDVETVYGPVNLHPNSPEAGL